MKERIYEDMRGRHISRNQHGTPVALMPATICKPCGIEVREGTKPKNAKNMTCKLCSRECWTIEHTRLGYVRGVDAPMEAATCDA